MTIAFGFCFVLPLYCFSNARSLGRIDFRSTGVPPTEHTQKPTSIAYNMCTLCALIFYTFCAPQRVVFASKWGFGVPHVAAIVCTVCVTFLCDQTLLHQIYGAYE